MIRSNTQPDTHLDTQTHTERQDLVFSVTLHLGLIS